MASLLEGGSPPLTAEGLTPESGLQWKVREVSIQFRLERRPTNFRSEFVCHLSHTRIGDCGVLGVFDPRFSRRVGAFFSRSFLSLIFAGDRMSEPCHCHIADRPLHFKRQEICTGVPRLKIFCILRVLRQTSKGQDPCTLALKTSQNWMYRRLPGRVIIVIVTSRAEHFILSGARSAQVTLTHNLCILQAFGTVFRSEFSCTFFRSKMRNFRRDLA